MDQLKKKIDVILSSAQNEKLKVFYGEIEDEQGLTKVSWNKENPDGHIRLLEFAKDTDQTIIIFSSIVNQISSDKIDLNSIKETLDDEYFSELKENLKKVEPHIGFIAHFKISFIKDKVIYEYSEDAKWFEFFERVNEILSDLDYIDDENDDDIKLTPAEIKKMSKELAALEDFATAKNRSQRRFVAVNHFGEKFENSLWTLEEIIEEATNIFKIDIEPKKEKELRKKIIELSKSGLTQSEIANELGITKGQLRKLS